MSRSLARRSLATLSILGVVSLAALPSLAQKTVRPIDPGQLKVLVPATTSQPILSTTFRNPPFNTSSPAWARDICRGKTFMSDSFPPYEWMQVFNPAQEVDEDVVGVGGTAVFTQEMLQHGGLSQGDVWFTHPFGLDWEFFVAPDPAYTGLLAPANFGRDSAGKQLDQEYNEATQRAAQVLHLSVPKGVLGVETDQDLVPPEYRAHEGDRVVLFGRWIVDAGHSDFHTEIHPPLLLVTGREGGGAIPATQSLPAQEATSVRLISRPYFVSQEFGDGALRQHLKNEIKKLEEVFASTRVEAHPHIRPKPFGGVHLLNFTAAPAAPRRSPNDKLMVAYHFTTRPGVVIQLIRNTDSVGAMISMNEVAYKAPPLPHRHDLDIPFSDIRKGAGVPGWLEFVLSLNPVAAVTLHRDWRTDRYDAPRAVSAQDNVINRMAVNDLPGNTPVTVDESQPFPIYGHMVVYWERAAGGPPTLKSGGAR